MPAPLPFYDPTKQAILLYNGMSFGGGENSQQRLLRPQILRKLQAGCSQAMPWTKQNASGYSDMQCCVPESRINKARDYI